MPGSSPRNLRQVVQSLTAQGAASSVSTLNSRRPLGAAERPCRRRFAETFAENAPQPCGNFGARLQVDFSRWGALERGVRALPGEMEAAMIRKLKSGGYRLYSRKINPKTGRRRNLGTFKTRAAAEEHERAVQYFKRH